MRIKRAPPPKIPDSNRRRKNSSIPRLNSCLECMRFNFDCGVAVWLQDLKPMTNEIMAFLNLKAFELGCLSRCFKWSLRTKNVGMIFLFEDESSALAFCDPLSGTRSPHGDFPFKAEHLGSYLRSVIEIERRISEASREIPTPSTSSIVVRNLQPSRRVSKYVLKLCLVFGRIENCELMQDAERRFEFHHLIVSYRFAVQAFAAQLGLDGKWITGQDYPLAVEVVKDDKVKTILRELLRRNKLLFQH